MINHRGLLNQNVFGGLIFILQLEHQEVLLGAHFDIIMKPDTLDLDPVVLVHAAHLVLIAGVLVDGLIIGLPHTMSFFDGLLHILFLCLL